MARIKLANLAKTNVKSGIVEDIISTWLHPLEDRQKEPG